MNTRHHLRRQTNRLRSTNTTNLLLAADRICLGITNWFERITAEASHEDASWLHHACGALELLPAHVTLLKARLNIEHQH